MKRQSAAFRPQFLPLSLSCLVLLVAGTGCSRASVMADIQGDKPAAATPAKPASQPAAAPGAPPVTGAAAAAAAAPQAGAASAAAPAADAKPIDPAKLPAVVARVNGQEIKKDDFLKEVKGVQTRMAQQQGVPADAAPPGLYHQVLDGMIARTLLENEAKTQGIAVTDDEVKKQLDQTRGQFPNPEAYKKALAEEGLTETQLQDNFKRQMV
ncbi:MAG TPA: SurA N-terminal domain-containing protein, partial [Thermoanaerobaculia bacterium]|nr:SurA N-terminal domain-containing protein [Thermoanaerobaculia bacterium]